MTAPLPPPLIPDNAPFTPAQRAWLNGFFAGLMGQQAGAGQSVQAPPPEAAAAAPVIEDDGDYPWHDPAIPLDERLALAEGKPFDLKLMAAMGQLDCGQCGYDCRNYAKKIADGSEPKLNLCVPGGRATHRTVKKLMAELDGPAADTPTADGAAPAPASAPVSAAASAGRAEPVTATVTEVRRLTAPSSAKDVRHVALDLAGTGLDYRVGDSLGVHATNDPALVAAIIARLGAEPSAEVRAGDRGPRPLREVLLERCDLHTVSETLLRVLAAAAEPAEAATLTALADADDGALDEDDVLDVLQRFATAAPAPQAFVDALETLQPRLYSISSSPRCHAGEVHLTVAVTRGEKDGRVRNGVASTFFAERVAPGTAVRVYRQPAQDFALPPAGETPIVMIGPGTGIAPFRAFLEERRAAGAGGRSWLFFGNPHAATDFLYREELEAFRAEAVLTRLDLAFSRDGAAKVYVQDRIREAGAELWRWLEEGAHVYVCGDATRMAKAVDDALAEVVAQHGARDGKAFLKALAAAGRYQRDVY